MSGRRLVAVVCALGVCSSFVGCSKGSKPGESARGTSPLNQAGDRFVTRQEAYSASVAVEDGSFTITPSSVTSSATSQFLTSSIERGSASLGFGAAGVVSDGQGGVGVGRGQVLERLQALPQGLELSWTFPAAPTGTGDVLVRLGVGGLQATSASAAATGLTDPASGAQLRVGQAVWVDAQGTRTTVDQVFASGVITFRVPEALLSTSSFPATLDPVVSPASIGQTAFNSGVANGTINALTVGVSGPGAITSSDGVINCGVTCSASYTSDSLVTLTATPNAGGAMFIGWSGLCSGSGPCTIPMSKVRFIYAYFEPGAWPVTIVKTGGGLGTVTGEGISCPTTSGVCTVQVPNTRPARYTATFSAAPDASSLFLGWSAVCAGPGSCSFFVDRPKSAYATFVPAAFTLSVATTGTGAGTVTGTGISCASGSTAGCSTSVANTTTPTQITLTAAPDTSSGSIFGGWSGVCSGLATTCTVTMDAAKGVTATFLKGGNPLSVTVSGAGTVTGGGLSCTSYSTSGCLVSVATSVPAPQVTLTATPDSGAIFAGWSGSCPANASPCTLTLDRAVSITAFFRSSQLQLAVVTTGHGVGRVAGSGIDCTSGWTSGCSALVDVTQPPTQVTLHATPDANSLFMGWSGPCGGMGDCAVSMDQVRTAYATFAPKNLTVTVLPTGVGGTVTGPNSFTCSSSAGCSFTVPNSTPAQQVVLTASPGATFIGWSGDCSGTGATCNLTVNDNKSVWANFGTGGPTPSTYQIGGTISGLVGSGLVLRNNGSDDLPVGASGTFAFATPVVSGATYAVTVAQQPVGQTCSVTNGSGTISNAAITNVAVTCSTATVAQYTVGGTVTGLVGSGLVLRNNGGDDLAVPGNGVFTFATPVVSGATYAVTVAQQPTNPAQTCTLSNGSGSVGAGNITGAIVTCSAVNGPVLWSYAMTGQLGDPAVADDDSLYVPMGGVLYSIKRDGTVRWTYNTGQQYGDTRATIAPDGTVYFAAGSQGNGTLYAITPTGLLKWQLATGHRYIGLGGLGSDGTIYVATITNGWNAGGAANVIAVDPSGIQRWIYSMPISNPFTENITVPVVGRDGTIYVLANYGLVALSPAGSLAFYTPTPTVPAGVPAIGEDGTLYFGSSYSTNYFAVGPDGAIRWTFTSGYKKETATALADDGTVYLGSHDANLYALTPSGSLRWSFQTQKVGDPNTPGIAGSGAVVARDGTVYVGAQDGRLYALDPNGQLLWSFSSGTPIWTAPGLASDGTVYLAAGSTLYALKGSAPLSGLSSWPKVQHDSKNQGRALSGVDPVP